jgi:predicted nucleotidyltransferase
MMELDNDTREFIELCLSKEVEFVLVGGYAVAAHGAPRFTEDIDLFIRISEENASKLDQVLNEFGFGNVGIKRSDFLKPRQVIQLGRPPRRIDLLTAIDGVTWEDAWNSKTEIHLSGLKCWAIGLRELIQNKRASGRPQDLADLARLAK